MFTDDLTESQRALLTELLEREVSDLGMEIAATDHLEYREMLKGKRLQTA